MRDKVPQRIDLLRPSPDDSNEDQLFLDRILLPRSAWNYNPVDHKILWHGPFGGGYLLLSNNELRGVGVIGGALSAIPVEIAFTVSFVCDLAKDAGVAFVTSGDKVVNLTWDPSSSAWATAPWIAETLLLEYIVQPGNNFVPANISFVMTDIQTGTEWNPGSQDVDFDASIENSGDAWILNFDYISTTIPSDDRSTLVQPNATTIDTVFPYILRASEDRAAQTITGALVIDQAGLQGEPLGLRGVASQPTIMGYYRLRWSSACGGDVVFGVFGGRMYVDDVAVPGTRLTGNCLTWSRLAKDLQSATGLPAEGSLLFNADGALALYKDGDQNLTARAHRLSGVSLTELLGENSRYCGLRAAHQEAAALSDDTELTIQGLLTMSQFVQDANGDWYDQVQANVASDLSQIMNSFIPSQLWSLIFPGQAQPSLTGQLATIANTPVAGVASNPTWYQSLATAVLTQGLAGGADPNCQYLNAPRAGAWLNQITSVSPVYTTHAQLLYSYEWAKLNPLTTQYLVDQADPANASNYASQIAQQVSEWIADVQSNVATDGSSPANMLQMIEAQFTELGNFATANNLYWAFAYCTYNTSPGVLANVALQMSEQIGSGDGTTYLRFIQENIAVLTALDSTGVMAQQYLSLLQSFLGTSVAPSMVDYSGSSNSYSLVLAYLAQFVKDNLGSENEQIQAVAVQLQQILDTEEQEKTIYNALQILRDAAEIGAAAAEIPYVAAQFIGRFSTAYPKLAKFASVLGSLLMSGVAMFGVLQMFYGFKDWDELTDEEKGDLILSASQFALQIVAAVVIRGAQYTAIFSADGLTIGQRLAALFRLDASTIESGLRNIANSLARWLGSVGEAGAELGRVASMIFGRNLTTFLATRIGPLFLFLGIGFALYQLIAGGETGLDEANDYLLIAGNLLSIFAVAGEWALTQLSLSAEVITVVLSGAGFLAVLAMMAGFALMIYESTERPPDPVQEFIQGYAAPAGFTVTAAFSAIDYVSILYANPSSNLSMIGFTMGPAGSALVLVAGPDGTIGVGAPDDGFATVWSATTDGLGLTTIFTQIDRGDGNGLVTVNLSAMSDGSVSFQNPVAGASGSSPAPSVSPSGPTVASQSWLATPQGQALLAGPNFYSMAFILQPVYPSSPSGQYSPSGAEGNLTQSGSTVVVSSNASTPFTLTMAGLAPTGLSMQDITIYVSAVALPSTPILQGSQPLTFALAGNLPSFLTFNGADGEITGSAAPTSPMPAEQFTLTASNALGSASANFTIQVEDLP